MVEEEYFDESEEDYVDDCDEESEPDDFVVRLILLQFSFSNWTAVPGFIELQDGETEEEYLQRWNSRPGVIKLVPSESEEEFQKRHIRKMYNEAEGLKEEVIPPTENCTLEKLPTDLEKSYYELVGAFVKGRNDDKGLYPVVRFTFAYYEYATPSEEFELVGDANYADLLKMTKKNFWRSRGFINQYFENQEPVPGHISLSFNFEARIPRYEPDGTLVTRWKRDPVTKEKIGDRKHPLEPDFSLRLTGEGPKLRKAK